MQFIKKIVLGAAIAVMSNVTYANELVAELQQKLQSLAGFSAQFSQKVTDSQGKVVQTTQGQVDIVQPNKFRWQTYEPNENLLVSDGQSVWFFDPFVEQVSIYNYISLVDSNPILLLLQPTSDAWQAYEIAKVADKTYRIKAKSQEQQIDFVDLAFSETDQVTAINIKDRQNQLSEYAFSAFVEKNSGDYAANFFKFAITDGIEVDDQR
ncbi:outer membrane lipoprotein carrier protein LolA [Catenovulum agarivorans DS-2]|uniref:Outer-membrane lipoprotein carrier protein n=1 Tax=Catenovulum agarivorans DS-2 TaxID=1328313 RepID=W7QN65_9ALTE|nr:outer membrane lipoprotein chaperone LolA [Catenovulum agarivorans]EWH10392.1 outer membrane lipoprotein carrier protein LolA [Catenovulum agarivorans DS-2]